MGVFSDIGKTMIEEAAKEQELLARLEEEFPSEDSAKEEATVPDEFYIGDDNIAYDGEDMLPVVVVNRVVPIRTHRAQSREPYHEVSLAPLYKERASTTTAPVIEEEENVSEAMHSAIVEPPTSIEMETESFWEDTETTPKKEDTPPLDSSLSNSISSSNYGNITGTIHFPSGGSILATIHGDISAKGVLDISGEIYGSVTAETINLDGIIHGALTCETLTLKSKESKIEGNLSVKSLSMNF